jgi:hypothetical protein
MIKMQILMNEQKINRDGKYSVMKIREALDNLFVNKLGLNKGDNGFYFGSDNSDDYGKFCVAYGKLRKIDWYTDNVSTWLFYISEDDSPNDFSIEDMRDYNISKEMVS